jgi:hypothetical protein
VEDDRDRDRDRDRAIGPWVLVERSGSRQQPRV